MDKRKGYTGLRDYYEHGVHYKPIVQLHDEIMKALGEAFEAAIAEAARIHQVRYTVLEDSMRRPPDFVFKTLLAAVRPAWRFHSVILDAYAELTLVRVRLECGHVAYISLDDHTLLLPRTKPGILDLIALQFSRPPERKCYCVQHEPQPPCTHGSCQ